MEIEKIAELVHKAYCAERLRQEKDAYWTNGDYSLLDDDTKEYDRVTIRAVLKAIQYDTLRQSHEKLVEAITGSKPYPVLSCLRLLGEAADHLLKDHNCDAHGYEEVGYARDFAIRHIENIKQALKSAEEIK